MENLRELQKEDSSFMGQSPFPEPLASYKAIVSRTQAINKATTTPEQEIVRQITEEGLLDGIDLNNLNVSQEDELSGRIADAYKRKQGRKLRSRDPSMLDDRVHQKERAILDWLSKDDSNGRLIDLESRRAAGTGQWVFKETSFQKWLRNDYQTLWAHGIRESSSNHCALTDNSVAGTWRTMIT